MMDVKRSGILTQRPSTWPSICEEVSILPSRRVGALQVVSGYATESVSVLIYPPAECVDTFTVLEIFEGWTDSQGVRVAVQELNDG